MAILIIEASDDKELALKVKQAIQNNMLPTSDWQFDGSRFIVLMQTGLPSGPADFSLEWADTNLELQNKVAGKMALGWYPFGSIKFANGRYVQAVTQGVPPEGGIATDIYSTDIIDSTPTGRAVLTAPDAVSARTAIGAGTVGNAVFVANTAAAGQTAIGITAFGQTLTTATDQASGRTALGAGTVGASLFQANTTDQAQTTLGATTVGKGVLTAATTTAAQVALGSTGTGRALFTAASTGAARTTLGSSTVGDALFVTASADAALTTLGGTTVGKALFTAASAGAALTTLGGGAAGTTVFSYATVPEIQAYLGIGGGGGGLPPGTIVGQTIQWDGDSWEPGLTPANAATYTKSAGNLGVSLPTINVTSAEGYPAGYLVINTTGLNNAAIYMMNGSTQLFSLTGAGGGGANWAINGPNGTGNMASTSSAASMNAPGGGTGAAITLSVSGLSMRGTSANNNKLVLDGSNLRPEVTAVTDLGSSTFRFRDCYLQNAPNVSSDATYKTAPEAIPDAVLDAVGDVNIVQFKMLTSVALKGDAARQHVGVIAQQVVQAFASHGVDAMEYGVVCYEEWPSKPEVRDPTTRALLSPAVEAGSMYSVRYEELLALEAARVRRELLR